MITDVRKTTIVWSSRYAIVIVIGCTACESYVATDGIRFAKDASHTSRDVWKDAVIASAAHDFSCDASDVRITWDNRVGATLVHAPPIGPAVPGVVGFASSPDPLAAVEACGTHAVYEAHGGRVVRITP